MLHKPEVTAKRAADRVGGRSAFSSHAAEDALAQAIGLREEIAVVQARIAALIGSGACDAVSPSLRALTLQIGENVERIADESIALLREAAAQGD